MASSTQSHYAWAKAKSLMPRHAEYERGPKGALVPDIEGDADHIAVVYDKGETPPKITISAGFWFCAYSSGERNCCCRGRPVNWRRTIAIRCLVGGTERCALSTLPINPIKEPAAFWMPRALLCLEIIGAINSMKVQRPSKSAARFSVNANTPSLKSRLFPHLPCSCASKVN